MPDIREEFEARYPLPEGMARNGDSYSGHKDWWLWWDRWEAWQASRAALKVELPEGFDLCDGSGAVVGYIDDFREALQQARIEVKQP